MKTAEKLNKEISTIFQESERKAMFKISKNVTYDEFLTNKLMIVSLIRTGVPYSLFNLIKDATPFSESDWAEFLNTSTKSLHRYKQEAKKFKPLQSEKIIEMAEVTNFGNEVFGDMEKFKLWLNTPNFSLGGMKPIELLKDSYGKEMVMGELTRIEHGIFA